MMPENFSYDNITTREALVAAYDLADDLTEMASDGDLVTDIVETGDVFFVKNGDDYWMLLTTDVSIVTTDNSDSYTFSIKK